MLKDIRLAGAYYDVEMSVSVMLKNPADYGYTASTLLLSVMLRAKDSSKTAPKLEEFAFSVMDEGGQLHDARCVPYTYPIITDAGDGDITRRPNGLIIAYFKHEFLFQDMRVAFRYRNTENINIISLRH